MKFNFENAFLTFIGGFVVAYIPRIYFDSESLGIILAILYVSAIISGFLSKKVNK